MARNAPFGVNGGEDAELEAAGGTANSVPRNHGERYCNRSLGRGGRKRGRVM